MIISSTVSVAANARSANVFAGEQFEFAPSRAVCTLRLSAAATGVRADLLAGGEAIVVNALVSNSNRFPIIPDDNVASFGVYKGERLVLTFRNSTAGALVVNYVLEMIPT